MNIVCTIIIIIFLKVKELKSSEYGYSSKEQKSWVKAYHDCGGHRQSPIFIDSMKAIPVAIPSLEFIDYHNMLPDHLKLVNNGHSVALLLNPNNETKSFVPYIFGAILENNYIFIEMHFHWGAQNNRGSEHILNSIQYPLEMHLIHRNVKYCTNEEAYKKRDGLVVLAVLFELRAKQYKPLNVIIDKFKLISEFGSTTAINSFELISIMPRYQNQFYLYTGSLTTPPCSEAVIWIIFPDPILISPEQINKFHILRNSRNMSLSDNFRIPQETEKRKIYKRMPTENCIKYKDNIKMLRNKLFC